MKAGQIPVDTEPNALYAGGGMSRGGGQFVTQSLSPLSSGESLYLAAGHQKGSGSRTPAGTITYSLQWLCEQQEHCVCVCARFCACVLSQSHTHMLAESHFPVTPLYLAALLGVIVGFEFLF